jgi:hypothetical protein
VDARYGTRTDRELEALWALETSIASVAAQFRGEQAFNFSHEAEIAAYLMVSIREAFGAAEPVGNLSVQLARMEWQCLPKRDIDLVLIHPDAATQARAGWGTIRGRVARTLPLLAAVQIKRGGGKPPLLDRVQKDLRDLEKIDGSPDLGSSVTYFLSWIDPSVESRRHQWRDYRATRDQLKTWCDQSPQNRRAFVLSRDRVGLAVPNESWLVQPLPPGTAEDPENGV